MFSWNDDQSQIYPPAFSLSLCPSVFTYLYISLHLHILLYLSFLFEFLFHPYFSWGAPLFIIHHSKMSPDILNMRASQRTHTAPEHSPYHSDKLPCFFSSSAGRVTALAVACSPQMEDLTYLLLKRVMSKLPERSRVWRGEKGVKERKITCFNAR